MTLYGETLNNAATKIAQLVAPFETVSKAIRTETDILQIIRTWRFQ